MNCEKKTIILTSPSLSFGLSNRDNWHGKHLSNQHKPIHSFNASAGEMMVSIVPFHAYIVSSSLAHGNWSIWCWKAEKEWWFRAQAGALLFCWMSLRTFSHCSAAFGRLTIEQTCKWFQSGRGWIDPTPKKPSWQFIEFSCEALPKLLWLVQ